MSRMPLHIPIPRTPSTTKRPKRTKKRRELPFCGMGKVRKRGIRRRAQTVRLIVSRNGLLTKRTEYGIIKPKASNGAGRGARGAKPRPSFKSMCLLFRGSYEPFFCFLNDNPFLHKEKNDAQRVPSLPLEGKVARSAG